MVRPRKQAADRGDVFHALADPTRRRVLELLSAGEQSVQDLAGHFPSSFAAVSQHLQTLHDAGLVQRREAGRRRLYTIDRAGLAGARAWIDGLAGFWDDAIDRLEAHLDDDER